MEALMKCRPGCAACCIAPSITTPIPGMPEGKPAGTPCVNLDEDLGCTLFGHADRPAVCSLLQPEADLCGDSREEALMLISRWEQETLP